MVSVCKLKLCNGADGVALDILVSQHDSFGTPRGAAGIVQMGNVVVLQGELDERFVFLVREQRFIVIFLFPESPF
jgi:hypothetical protein